MRKDILNWFLLNAGPRFIIGGDLNSSLQSLDDVLKVDNSFRYLYEPGHMHGDVAIVKNLEAESMPCEVISTSKVHKMVVVIITFSK